MVPPTWVRRLVLAPALVAITAVVVAALPALGLLLALLAPVLPGRTRALRVLWVAVVHLVLESLALSVLFVLWVASGFGALLQRPGFQRVHYEVVASYLRIMYDETRRVMELQVQVEGPLPDAYLGRPLLVFSRHAGPGDSFLVAHALVNWYAREPRIVLKDTLQWDPAIDVMLNRLPNRFVGKRRRGVDVEAEVGRLAQGLDTDDAFVIFPEGGNFTEERRERAIARLHGLGLHATARRAERMMHVLAPRPGGVVAALANAPDADVVWVAHTGLDHLAGVADVWAALPMRQPVLMRWWLVPAGEVPTDEAAQIDWLYGWWERIDAWVTSRRVAD
jgi:1-acyl-sn-glycerol-3-phosphate acyltransferase